MQKTGTGWKERGDREHEKNTETGGKESRERETGNKTRKGRKVIASRGEN